MTFVGWEHFLGSTGMCWGGTWIERKANILMVEGPWHSNIKCCSTLMFHILDHQSKGNLKNIRERKKN